MALITVGPFNRVEGDLEVRLEVADGHVVQAWANAPMYRGFEQILEGKDPRDALVLTPRLCGICSRTFGDDLAAIVALASAADLAHWADRQPPTASDFSHFLHLSTRLGLAGLGRATDRFMSYGGYLLGGRRLLRYGLWDQGPRHLDIETITEDQSHSRMRGADAPLHPSQGITLPDADAPGGYTWCKAPRLGGQVVEVGALARQMVDGHPLIRDLVARDGGNVQARLVARLLETARVTLAMDDWIRLLVPGEPFCVQGELPDAATGAGLVEAARGALGHWLCVRKGRIRNYQIIAPTTWNFSPRDRAGVPGALEQALVGAPVRPGERTPIAVQHIVRSFDPCMVCTVH